MTTKTLEIHSDTETDRFHCKRCDRALPIRPVENHLPAVSCRCAQCGARYRGTIIADRIQELACNIVPDNFGAEPCEPQSCLSPETITGMIDELFQPYKGPERRLTERKRIALGVSVLPVDEEFYPVGRSFIAVTCDVSAGGMSLLHTRPVSAPYLIIELPSVKRANARLQVLRCHRREGLYKITGQFAFNTDSRCDTVLHQTRDVTLSPAAWQIVDAVSRQLKRSPDSLFQSLLLSTNSPTHRCLAKCQADLDIDD